MLPIRSLDFVDSNITQTLTGWTYFLYFPVTGRVARAFSGVFYIGSKYLTFFIVCLRPRTLSYSLTSTVIEIVWQYFTRGGYCLGDYCSEPFMDGVILSWGDIVWGILSGWCYPRTGWLDPNPVPCIPGLGPQSVSVVGLPIIRQDEVILPGKLGTTLDVCIWAPGQHDPAALQYVDRSAGIVQYWTGPW